ncbi:MAG: histidine kinase [Rhodospirillaceae bacterium]|nr:MAG: histidine kinase [Rhodospirillaceae bacterium]
MTVARIIKQKGTDTVSVRPDTPLTEAIQLLSKNNIGALVVSEDGFSVAGILSERDIIRGLAKSGAAFLEQPVRTLMTSAVKTCSPQDTTMNLLARMTEQRIRHMPVVEDDHLAGIVSIGDVVKLRLDDLATDVESLRDYITQ